MSKLKKYTTSFDDNPNSDIAASKRVVSEYKKILEKETLKPIIQEMNNQTKSVVTNLNDYSLLLKNITQNLVNAELYLSNSEVSKSKGAGRLIGSGLSEKEKADFQKYATQKNITSKSQAINYIRDKYAETEKTKMTQGDKNIMRLYGLYQDDKGDTNMRGITNPKVLLGRMKDVTPVQVPQQVEQYETPDILYGRYSTPASASTITPVKANIRDLTSKQQKPTFQNQFVKKAINMSDDYDSSSSENSINPLSRRGPSVRSKRNVLKPPQKSSLFSSNSSSNFGVTPSNLDDVVEGDRYSLHPQPTNIHGGDPGENKYDNDNDNFDLDSVYDENTSVPTVNEIYNQQTQFNGEEDNNFDAFEQDVEDFNLQEFINHQGHTPIRENFIITLFSNIINQVHKASDFWETYITPNLSDIPKLKMDSFIKSNSVNNFEKAIQKIESKLTSGIIKTYLSYLDNIYHNLTRALDELFERMNIDINRYSSGLSSSNSDKPQLLGSGYLPFKASIYSSHLRNSNTKYLM
jgi:hypothetical protein